MQTLFLWTGNIYILWSVRASSLLCLSHKTWVFIGSTVRQKYEFPPVYVLQLADGEQFPKDDALCQPVSDQGLFWIVFFSTQMKWRHTCCPQHVPSSVSAFSCSVFLSEGYCSAGALRFLWKATWCCMSVAISVNERSVLAIRNH